MKSGNLNFLEPSGPLQACNGTDLPLPIGAIFRLKCYLLKKVKYKINVKYILIIIITINCVFLDYIFSDLYTYVTIYQRGPGSLVGIATGYGLDGPGIESRWGEIFRPSRPALGPTQPPVQRVPGLSRE